MYSCTLMLGAGAGGGGAGGGGAGGGGTVSLGTRGSPSVCSFRESLFIRAQITL